MNATKREVPVFFRLDVALKERLRGLAKRERRSMKEQLSIIIEHATTGDDDVPPADGSTLIVT